MALLDALPLDVLLIVLRDVTVEDILNLRLTCKSLQALTFARSVWHDALYLHVVSRGLPVPGMDERPIVSLSGPDLEHLTLGALRLRKNWTSENPKPTKCTELSPVPEALSGTQRPRVLALFTLPGRGNRFLISLTLRDQGARPRTYSIDCWDLKSASPLSIANFQCTNLFSTAVNGDPKCPYVFSITRNVLPEPQTDNIINANGNMTTTVLGLDFTCPDPRAAFTPGISFPSFKHSLLFKGSTFLATDSSHQVRVFDVKLGALQYLLCTPLLHDDPTLQLDEFRCLNATLVDNFVLIFRQQWIHLYYLPPIIPGISPDTQPLELLPVAEHKWQWRIDTLTLFPHTSHPLLSQFSYDKTPEQKDYNNDTPKPICLLLRFDSWFPWPVNILHQFILPPNPHYDPSARFAPNGAGPIRVPKLSLPYLATSASLFLSLSPAPPSSLVPRTRTPSEIQLQPYMVASLPSPIRIFTPSDTVLGAYGTALWLDAQTDVSAPAQAGDHGQRIAGRMLRFVPPSPQLDESREMPRHAVNLEGAAEDADGKETAESAVVVYQMQEENDTWGKLTLCDEEGRIAVGCTDGRIFVFEYA